MSEPANPAARLLAALHPAESTRKRVATVIAQLAAELSDPDLVDMIAADVEGHPNAVTTTELAKRAGISYRQADYWTGVRYLHTVIPAEGSGSRRLYDEREVIRARIMGSLVNLIGMNPATAAEIATDILEVGHADVEGFRITRRRAVS